MSLRSDCSVMMKLLICAMLVLIFENKAEQITSNLNSATPVNSYDYHYLHNPYCHLGYELANATKLTIVVKTREDNFKRRMAIRETWGFEDQLWPDVSIRTVFSVGVSDDAFISDRVRVEFQMYQDIVQCDFQDTYRNNTLKTILGLNWAANNCKETDFFLFVDDDMFVSVKNLMNALK